MSSFNFKPSESINERYGNIIRAHTKDGVFTPPKNEAGVPSMRLSYSHLSELPSDITEVRGSLYLEFTRIRELPPNLKAVYGGLNLDATPLIKLPDSLEYVDSFLDLRHTQISTVPSFLEVKHSLYLSYCPNIKSLPRTITCENLYIVETPLANNHKIDKLKKWFPNVKNFITKRW